MHCQCFPLLMSKHDSIRRHAFSLLKHCFEWQYLTYRTAARAVRDREVVGVAAEPYLMFSGYVTLASHWLKMEEIAYEKLEAKNGSLEDDFYKTKVVFISK
jgi:hypothetical protein